MKELLQYCSAATGYAEGVVNIIVSQFIEGITRELAAGHSVDLGKNFGTFSVKLRTSHLAENSPRTPKDSRYKVIFRENSGMRRRLKIEKGC